MRPPLRSASGANTAIRRARPLAKPRWGGHAPGEQGEHRPPDHSRFGPARPHRRARRPISGSKAVRDLGTPTAPAPRAFRPIFRDEQLVRARMADIERGLMQDQRVRGDALPPLRRGAAGIRRSTARLALLAGGVAAALAGAFYAAAEPRRPTGAERAGLRFLRRGSPARLRTTYPHNRPGAPSSQKCALAIGISIGTGPGWRVPLKCSRPQAVRAESGRSR